MSHQFLESLAVRRTIYGLSKENFPVSNARIEKIVKEIIQVTPTSFNAQTNRALVLFGDNHEKLWNDITYNTLKSIVPPEQFEATSQKIKAFGAAYGTVLFFVDKNTIREFEDKFKLYAHYIRPMAEQAAGAAHINAWTAVSLEGAGANLQHYNELIGGAVAREFNVPENWELSAQLVFGTKVSAPGEKTTLPTSETVIIAK